MREPEPASDAAEAEPVRTRAKAHKGAEQPELPATLTAAVAEAEAAAEAVAAAVAAVAPGPWSAHPLAPESALPLPPSRASASVRASRSDP